MPKALVVRGVAARDEDKGRQLEELPLLAQDIYHRQGILSSGAPSNSGVVRL